MKRRRPQVPARKPHPDARVEVQLQQIVSLRRAAERNEQLLDQYHQDITRMNGVIGAHPTWDGHRTRRSQIAFLSEEIERLNAETSELHEQIRELCAKLADDDLLWLDPRAAS